MVLALEQIKCFRYAVAGGCEFGQQTGNQWCCQRRGIECLHERSIGLVNFALGCEKPGLINARSGGARRGCDGFLQQSLRLLRLLAGDASGRLLAQVMREPALEVALSGVGQLMGNQGRLRPVAAAFIVGQQSQTRLCFKRCSFELEQRVFGTVEQAGLEVVQRQRMLGALAIGQAEVATREQMVMHPHGAFVLAAAAKQVAQRKVQFGGVRVVLNRFDEGIDGLVLLLVEQEIQTLEIGFRGLAIFKAQLAQIEPRGQPTQAEGQWQTEQDPAQVKVHAGQPVALSAGLVDRQRRGAASTSAAPCPAHPRQRRRQRC